MTWYEFLFSQIGAIVAGVIAVVQMIIGYKRETNANKIQAELNRQNMMFQAKADLSRDFISKKIELAILFASESSALETDAYNLFPTKRKHKWYDKNLNTMRTARNEVMQSHIAFSNKYQQLRLFVSEDTYKAIASFEASIIDVVDVMDYLIKELTDTKSGSDSWMETIKNCLDNDTYSLHDRVVDKRLVAVAKLSEELKNIKDYG